MGRQRAGPGWDKTIAARFGQSIDRKLDALLAIARQVITRVGEIDEAT